MMVLWWMVVMPLVLMMMSLVLMLVLLIGSLEGVMLPPMTHSNTIFTTISKATATATLYGDEESICKRSMIHFILRRREYLYISRSNLFSILLHSPLQVFF